VLLQVVFAIPRATEQATVGLTAVFFRDLFQLSISTAFYWAPLYADDYDGGGARKVRRV
jgi:hypothetical protein